MVAMTRIAELEGGRIEIDGVDVASLELTELRSKITVIE